MNSSQRAAALAALGKLEKRVEQLRWRERAAQNLATMSGGACDPYGVLLESLGFEVQGVFRRFSVLRPTEDMPKGYNPYGANFGVGA